jgi:hypothetical protein
MEWRRCLGIDRSRIEELFYDDLYGPCRSTRRPANAPSQTGRARSLLLCEIYSISMRRSQRSWQLSTIMLIWTIRQSQPYYEYGLGSTSCPSRNCVPHRTAQTVSVEKREQRTLLQNCPFSRLQHPPCNPQLYLPACHSICLFKQKCTMARLQPPL